MPPKRSKGSKSKEAEAAREAASKEAAQAATDTINRLQAARRLQARRLQAQRIGEQTKRLFRLQKARQHKNESIDQWADRLVSLYVDAYTAVGATAPAAARRHPDVIKMFHRGLYFQQRGALLQRLKPSSIDFSIQLNTALDRHTYTC